MVEDIYDIRYFVNVHSLAAYSFESCSGLKNVTIPISIKTVGSHLFRNSGIISCIIPEEGITALSNFMFVSCAKLAAVQIPEGVTTIGEQCFRRASPAANALLEISYPSTVTSFGAEVHLYNGLQSFTIKAVNPPTLASARMFNYGRQPAIYVPAESIEAYKAAEYWSSYKNYIRAIPE